MTSTASRIAGIHVRRIPPSGATASAVPEVPFRALRRSDLVGTIRPYAPTSTLYMAFRGLELRQELIPGTAMHAIGHRPSHRRVVMPSRAQRAKAAAAGARGDTPPAYEPAYREAYVGWIRRFILFHGKRHPGEMGPVEIT